MYLDLFFLLAKFQSRKIFHTNVYTYTYIVFCVKSNFHNKNSLFCVTMTLLRKILYCGGKQDSFTYHAKKEQ